MPVASMIELLEAGVHFGHQTQRWNPKMKKYIYGERNGIYIINLQKTTQLLDEAYNLVREYAAKGKNVVFVGTKKQAADVVAEESRRSGAFFINRRWLGGTLTNFETIKTRINKLRELEGLRDNGHFDRLPKKEVAILTKQLEKLEKTLGGIKEMRGMPDLLFVIDQKKEFIAVQEANKLGIPIICVVDTNSDPDNIDYVIPANDDAIRSIKLITQKIADAVIEGKKLRENTSVDAIKGNVQEVKAEDAGVTKEEIEETTETETKTVEETKEDKEI
ncbi:MAG: 30S ribosomal protein S2 [Candidatus Gastranaerophilaceae bacterium]|jgi:small subunit ribosomal protein S2